MANMDDEDQTRDARTICRSLACLRIDLCETRVASSEKLQKEWDERLENNSMAEDRLQENRELWLRAGGPDPELLGTPTALHLKQASKAVTTLDAMLEKHSPAEGLASFVEEIKAGGGLHLTCAYRSAPCAVRPRGARCQATAKLLKVVGWESIKSDTRANSSSTRRALQCMCAP
jgi:hypothetical protein